MHNFSNIASARPIAESAKEFELEFEDEELSDEQKLSPLLSPNGKHTHNDSYRWKPSFQVATIREERAEVLMYPSMI
jgi:hypothetical protein